MNILLVGESGTSKSNLGDILRRAIFRTDPNSHIHTDDPSRDMKEFGHGTNLYNISVRQLKKGEKLTDLGDLSNQDVVVFLNGPEFKKWFEEVYTK